jgi:putative ABC transport system permease protein
MRLGILKEIFQMSFDSIRNNKLRSFLTLLGIMIGVMTVIAMTSVIQGLNKSFLSELESVGSDIIAIGKFEPGVIMGGHSEEIRQRKDFTFDDAMAIKTECSNITAVAIDIMVDMFQIIPVKYQSTKSNDAMILGMNEDWPQVLTVYLPERGRFLSESDITHRSKVCILGADLNETLFPYINGLGKEIRIGPEKFTVVGILEKRGSIFGQSQDNFVGIPLTTLMKYFPYDLSNLEIIAKPDDHANYSEAEEQIINVLRRRRKVPFGKPNDFAVYGQDAIIDLYNQITGAVFLVMIVISSIGLLVGGIGVMNIMLVTVKERTREIGIRKAIGARPNDILKQFLIEAIFLTGTGGVAGILVGFLIALLVRTATPLPAAVTLWSVMLGFCVSFSVGLCFGILPARKAAKMNPIAALRYE